MRRSYWNTGFIYVLQFLPPFFFFCLSLSLYYLPLCLPLWSLVFWMLAVNQVSLCAVLLSSVLEISIIRELTQLIWILSFSLFLPPSSSSSSSFGSVRTQETSVQTAGVLSHSSTAQGKPHWICYCRILVNIYIASFFFTGCILNMERSYMYSRALLWKATDAVRIFPLSLSLLITDFCCSLFFMSYFW